ncbi:hypothetical protein ACFL1X_01630 [Candidatus Hydrogenedentota bacterium]
MMKMFTRCLFCFVVAVASVTGSMSGEAAGKVIHLDCGTAKSPVMKGYKRLTASEQYTESRGYGWETPSATDLVFKRPVPNPEGYGSYGETVLAKLYETDRNNLNQDGVISKDDLIFRCDVPDGRYRVSVMVGDWHKTLGSMDIIANGKVIGNHIDAWRPATYRMFDYSPFGWPTTIRGSVDAKDGYIWIKVSKNETFLKEQMAVHAKMDNPYIPWPHKKPLVKEPPYFFIGFPWVHNGIMAIDITPDTLAPITGVDEQLTINGDIKSPALREAVAKFNAKDFEGSLIAANRVKERDAQVPKAVLYLWLAGRLEIEDEETLVPAAEKILSKHVKANPNDHGVVELLSDTKAFLKALDLHLNRGRIGKIHFDENNKAITWWLLIREYSPLYYKSQLLLARAGHMLKPYMPPLGMEGDIFRRLEKKFPDNRFLKFYVHNEWGPYGDGTHYKDWVWIDHDAKVKDAPDWVQSLYPAYNRLVDMSEWWIKFRQMPEGNIGGGWPDDVEIVGLFGYYGYISRGSSELSAQGARNLCNGQWNLSPGIDTELGYCLPMSDAEHSAEPTGNTLGMMVQIDYGNPIWIERSMKTGKLMRDLWTDFNDKGKRHFRSNFFGSAQVGIDETMNDSWINYRAIRPANAVLWYNNNPTISKLIVELADAWVSDAMSTERGKPMGVIPAQVSFPDAILGGTSSPNWWMASHPGGAGVVNYDWWDDKLRRGQSYKNYLIQLLTDAYMQTGDMKYVEPLKLEHDLALKHGFPPELSANKKSKKAEDLPGEPGSDLWIAARMASTDSWIEIKRVIDGRKGALKNFRTKTYFIEAGERAKKHLKKDWPHKTSESGPPDRVGFHGISSVFFAYTGGGYGGPLLRAAVTYENTTRDFAAGVLGHDSMGLRILYYSLAPETRKIGVVPWELEAGGKYKLTLGIDENDNEKIDKIVEERIFEFRQPGDPFYITVEPRKTYIIEVDQVERGQGSGFYPDPGLSAEDIRLSGNLLMARIHNIGSKPVHNVWVAAYDGNPVAGGKLIGKELVPNIEAPLDLEPKTTTVGFGWNPKGKKHDIYIVIDPDDTIKDEITTFNNVAHTTLPKKEEVKLKKLDPGVLAGGGRGR